MLFFATLLGALGCTPERVMLVVEPTELVATVLRADWATVDACVGLATFEIEGEAPFTRSERVETREHSLLLPGLPAEASVDVSVSCADGSEPATAEAKTGPIPTDLPQPTATTRFPGNGYFTLPILGAQAAATLVDMEGRVVWYKFESEANAITRVRVARDGSGVLYNRQDYGITGVGTGKIVQARWDGTVIREVPVQHHTHDFVELPDGTIAAIVTEVEVWDGSELRGNKILEIAVDGSTRVVWSAWDDSSPSDEPSQHPAAPEWTHANALDFDETSETYWISLRNLDSIQQIDRTTGEVLRRLGGPRADVTFADPAAAWLGQHQFQWLDNGHLLVFDNRSDSDSLSRAVEYAPTGDTLTQVWSWEAPYWVYALGDVDRDAHGTRITLTSSGEIRQLDENDQTTAILSANLGTAFGYSERVLEL